MQTFHRPARLAPAILAAAVIATGLAAGPALAGPAPAASPQIRAVTWTVTPGGAITGESGTALLKDTATGSTIKCTASTFRGTLKKGSGLPGNGLGSLTSVGYEKCVGPLDLSFTITASASAKSPWRLNAKSYNATTGVTKGTISNVMATVTGAGCQATLAGSSATTPGTVKITYGNSVGKLGLLGPGSTLHFWNVTGCESLLNSGDALFNNGDPATAQACYGVTPKQTITGMPPSAAGTGPPC